MSQGMIPYHKCPLRGFMGQVIISIIHHKHLISHTIVLILEPHAITTNSIETKGSNNTTAPSPNVTTAKVNISSKRVKSLSRTRPSIN